MRRLLREIGSIVPGVLIALAIGAIADTLRHRIEARRTLAAIRRDMADDSSAFDLQPLLQACAVRRIAEMTATVRHVGSGGNLGSRRKMVRSSEGWRPAISLDFQPFIRLARS